MRCVEQRMPIRCSWAQSRGMTSAWSRYRNLRFIVRTGDDLEHGLKRQAVMIGIVFITLAKHEFPAHFVFPDSTKGVWISNYSQVVARSGDGGIQEPRVGEKAQVLLVYCVGIHGVVGADSTDKQSIKFQP